MNPSKNFDCLFLKIFSLQTLFNKTNEIQEKEIGSVFPFGSEFILEVSTPFKYQRFLFSIPFQTKNSIFLLNSTVKILTSQLKGEIFLKFLDKDFKTYHGSASINLENSVLNNEKKVLILANSESKIPLSEITIHISLFEIEKPLINPLNFQEYYKIIKHDPNYYDLPLEASIYEGCSLLSGKNYRFQVYKKDELSDEDYFRVKCEIDIRKKIQHPNFVQLVEVFEDEDYLTLVLEKCKRFKATNLNLFSEESTACFINQILRAIKYLHNYGLYFQNLNLHENIFLLETENNHIKINFCRFFYPNHSKQITY